MNSITRHISDLLTRYSTFNGDEESPIPLAWLAGWFCFAFTSVAVNPMDSWGRTLFCSGLPILLIFSVLYHSPWQRQLGYWTRLCSLLLNAGIIFISVLLSLVFYFIAGCMFINQMGAG